MFHRAKLKRAMEELFSISDEFEDFKESAERREQMLRAKIEVCHSRKFCDWNRKKI